MSEPKPDSVVSCVGLHGLINVDIVLNEPSMSNLSGVTFGYKAATRDPMQFNGMSTEDARAFAEKWLPAWSGNRPELLASFYSADAVYSDPAIPAGVRRNDAIHAYFTKLLGRNPEWVWTHTGSIPMQDGFLNRWHASIPVAQRTVEAHGVCTVQLRGGLIYANHVYFDRSELLATLSEA